MYAHHERSALVRASFTSHDMGEFVIVEVALKFNAAESQDTILLEAACRQLVRHRIMVVSPLDHAAHFTGNFSNADIRFHINSLVVPPHSEHAVKLLFRPIEKGAGESEVTLRSADPGVCS